MEFHPIRLFGADIGVTIRLFGVDIAVRRSAADGIYSDHEKRKEDEVPFSLRIPSAMPMRWFHPDIGFGSFPTQATADQEFMTSATAAFDGPSTASRKKRTTRKRKQSDHAAVEKKNRKPAKRVRVRNDQLADDDEEIPSMEEILGLIEAVRVCNGTPPVFLYKKRLERSDVKADQNRLFVTKMKRVMEFLTAEERRELVDQGGNLDVKGVDAQSEVYNLRLKIWKSLNELVVKLGWNKVVSKNKDAQKDNVVELWGFRQQDGKPCFAVNFRVVAAAAPEAQAEAPHLPLLLEY